MTSLRLLDACSHRSDWSAIARSHLNAVSELGEFRADAAGRNIEPVIVRPPRTTMAAHIGEAPAFLVGSCHECAPDVASCARRDCAGSTASRRAGMYRCITIGRGALAASQRLPASSVPSPPTALASMFHVKRSGAALGSTTVCTAPSSVHRIVPSSVRSVLVDDPSLLVVGRRRETRQLSGDGRITHAGPTAPFSRFAVDSLDTVTWLTFAEPALVSSSLP